MRRAHVKCNVLYGYQAAVTLNITVVCTLQGGLIMDVTGWPQVTAWYEEYQLIRSSRTFKWSEEDWLDKGYILRDVPYIQGRPEPSRKPYTRTFKVPFKRRQ